MMFTYSKANHARWGLALLATLLVASCGGGSPDVPTNAAPSASQKPTSVASNECGATVWSAEASYRGGDIVLYQDDGNYYQALHDNSNYVPATSGGHWSRVECPTPQVPSQNNPVEEPTQPTSLERTTSELPSTHSPTSENGLPFTEAQFNQMFPNRIAFYTYSEMVAAISVYPAMFNGATETTRKQEAAAFLANVYHETGGLVHIREMYQENWPSYCASSAVYPCAPGQQYYGRGPIQLSWNYNYGAAGAALELNLLQDPDLVARDAKVAWQTAMWFWMTQTGAGHMTAHQAMVDFAGFGETIRTINGVLECNHPPGSGGNRQMQMRVQYYIEFTKILGVPTGANLTC